MNDILFRIFPLLAKHMSHRASNLLSRFGLLALLVLALYTISLSGFKESSGVLFVVFLAVTAMIPISFLISWILDIKDAWDMRVVTVIPPSGDAFPQSAISARKGGYKFRKTTKEERIKWGLDKKDKLSAVFRKLLYMTNEEIEAKRLDRKLADPTLSMEEYMEIRNEQRKREPKRA